MKRWKIEIEQPVNNVICDVVTGANGNEKDAMAKAAKKVFGSRDLIAMQYNYFNVIEMGTI